MIVGVAALLGFLGTGFYSYSRGIFLPSLAEALADGSRFAISMGFSGAAVAGTIVSPWLGRYLDSHSPKRVILIGIGIVSTSYVLLGNVQSLWQFYLVVGLGMGLGMTSMGTISWHRSIIYWFDHWRGRAIAFAVMGASVAGIMMPPLVTALVDAEGWRAGYLVFAASTAICLVPVVYLFMRDRPEDVGEVRDGRHYVETHSSEMVEIADDQQVWQLEGLLKAPALWSIGLIFGSMVCVFTMVMLHLFGHLLDIGLSTTEASAILSITAVFAALGKPVIGWLSDALGARISIWLALTCQAAALLMFTQADTWWFAAVAGATYGFGYSGMSPLRTFAMSVSFGSRSFALATGVLRWVELPFLLSASPLAGLIYDTTGSYQIAFYILAGLMSFACIGPLFIKVGGARERARLVAAHSRQ